MPCMRRRPATQHHDRTSCSARCVAVEAHGARIYLRMSLVAGVCKQSEDVQDGARWCYIHVVLHAMRCA